MVSKHFGITGEVKRSEHLVICGVCCEQTRKKLTLLLLAFRKYCSLHSSISLFPPLQKGEDEILPLSSALIPADQTCSIGSRNQDRRSKAPLSSGAEIAGVLCH